MIVFNPFKKIAVATFLFLFSVSAYAVDNQVFSQVFNTYNETIGEFTDELASSIKSGDWSKSTELSVKLKKMSEKFVALSEDDGKPIWGIYASNLNNHTTELQEALAAKEEGELIFLVGVLRDHIGYIQSTNAQWLRIYYPDQIVKLGAALKSKNKDAAAEHAEVLHLGGNKIAVSAGMQKGLYSHSRWLNDIIEVSRLGDQIIGLAYDGKFADAQAPYKKMQRAFKKWDKSFKK